MNTITMSYLGKIKRIETEVFSMGTQWSDHKKNTLKWSQKEHIQMISLALPVCNKDFTLAKSWSGMSNLASKLGHFVPKWD